MDTPASAKSRAWLKSAGESAGSHRESAGSRVESMASRQESAGSLTNFNEWMRVYWGFAIKYIWRPAFGVWRPASEPKTSRINTPIREWGRSGFEISLVTASPAIICVAADVSPLIIILGRAIGGERTRPRVWFPAPSLETSGGRKWVRRGRRTPQPGAAVLPMGGTIQFGKRFLARRRKRQPGRSRSPAMTQPCGQRQFGLHERGKGRLKIKVEQRGQKMQRYKHQI